MKRKAVKSNWLVLLAALLLWGAMPLPLAASCPPMTFGTFPFLSPSALTNKFHPLLEELSGHLGCAFVLEAGRTYPAFERRLVQGRYDLAYAPSHTVLLALDTGQYDVIAQLSNPLEAWVLVRADSPIDQAAQLSGQKVGTPPIEAVLTLLGEMYLKKHTKTPPQFRALRSHNAAYKSLLAGEVQAAIVSVNVGRRALAQEENLRLLTQTDPILASPMVVHRRVPSTMRQEIQAHLIQLNSSFEGQRLLKKIGYPGFKAASNADYQQYRPLLKELQRRRGDLK